MLPAGAPKIEGRTVGDDDNVYVSTFDLTASSGSAKLFVFKKDGKLLRSVGIGGSSPATLGLAFHPVPAFRPDAKKGRSRDMAAVASTANAPLPELYRTYLRRWTLLGIPAFLALVAVFWLMIAKPTS